MQVACGQCIGCKLERSRQWAVRMMHEAEMYEDNCFITLTYSPEKLPHDGSLDVSHFQKFIKRLRKRSKQKFKYFHCGEYGEKLERPHYHAIIFGLDFDDKIEHSGTGEYATYTSDTLDDCWGNGFCLIGSVTFESAAYVARYCTKKRTGKDAEWYYYRSDEFGVAGHQVRPEYCTMSRGRKTGDGIGGEWFRRYSDELINFDEVIVNGHPCKPPRYYDYLLKRNNEGAAEQTKIKRKKRAQRYRHDSTPERLKQREQCVIARTQQLHRKYENGP